MVLTFQQELYLATRQAFRTVVPYPHERIPWTSATLPYLVTPFIPFVFLAYLARRRDTFLIRLLLLPTIIMLSIRVAFGYYWTNPRLSVLNWEQSLVAMWIIARSLDLGLSRNGRMKIGETKIPPIGGEPRSPNSPPSSPVAKKRRQHLPIPACIYDSLEIIAAFRGIGWDFGRDVYIPQETRPLERGAFLRATSLLAFKNYVLLDILDSLCKLIPNVGSPEGGSIFFPQLPVVTRYALSTAIHVCTGTCLIAVLHTVYHVCTLVSVGLLGQSPLSWPPVLDNPWAADSLNNFWAKRWHQLLRRLFVVYGGYPVSWITGGSRVGMVFGVFLASGMYHELPIYTMGKGLDHSITLFFVWQAFGVLLEKAWKDVTGYRVRGWGGLAWVYFSIIVVGQPCVNAWHVRGLGGSLIIPPSLSPVKGLLWPALKYLLGLFNMSIDLSEIF